MHGYSEASALSRGWNYMGNRWRNKTSIVMSSKFRKTISRKDHRTVGWVFPSRHHLRYESSHRLWRSRLFRDSSNASPLLWGNILQDFHTFSICWRATRSIDCSSLWGFSKLSPHQTLGFALRNQNEHLSRPNSERGWRLPSRAPLLYITGTHLWTRNKLLPEQISERLQNYSSRTIAYVERSSSRRWKKGQVPKTRARAQKLISTVERLLIFARSSINL